MWWSFEMLTLHGCHDNVIPWCIWWYWKALSMHHCNFSGRRARCCICDVSCYEICWSCWMTQSHRKEPHVISSNTVITSCEKGRKWFLLSVLLIDAKFVGVMEPLRVRLFTAVVHPLYCGILTELNNWVFQRVLCLRRLVDAGAKEAYQYSLRLGLWVSVRRFIAGELWENWR